MRRDSALTGHQRVAVIALFEEGYGPVAAATRLGVGRSGVGDIYLRWRVRGGDALVARSTQQRYPFDVKLKVVQRYLGGESKIALAEEFNIASPKTVAVWARVYEREGEVGLRPKVRGRPPKDTDVPPRAISDLERLEQENLELRAKVAYLEKLKALIAQEQQ